MSITAVRKLPCRACGHLIEAVTIESANPTRHPHFQDQLLARTLLRMPCPLCRTEHIHYGRFVWTDLPGRLCVMVLHESERQAWAHLETSVRAVLCVPFLEEGPPVVRALGQETALRLAFGLEELREKVLCRVHDLDDRIIEAMKTELPYGAVLDAVLPAEALVFRDDRSVTVSWGIYEETAARRDDLAAELPGIFGPGATWVNAARCHRAPMVEPGVAPVQPR